MLGSLAFRLALLVSEVPSPNGTLPDPNSNRGVAHLTGLSVKLLVIGVLIAAPLMLVWRGKATRAIRLAFVGLTAVISLTVYFAETVTTLGGIVGAVLAIIRDIVAEVMES